VSEGFNQKGVNKMSDKLEQLCERYPAIFAKRHASPSQSCMARGFECGEGSFNLIDTMCSLLQHETDKRGAPQVTASQVKEKFGQLRFYSDAPRTLTERQSAYIAMAVALSGVTCEVCGAPGLLKEHQRWLSTRCEKHSREAEG
jgi:hypothetical protein